MKKIILATLSLISILSLRAQTPDPNYHIYLAIGQSNMEGQGTAESADQSGYDAQRFKVFGTVNCNSGGKSYTVGKEVAASSPIFRCNTKVSLIENFGKVYLAGQPANVKVGIVPVAIAGCKIELFDKNNYQSYANGAESWMKNIINEYGGNPYARLITAAKEAQKVGVIKGILFHQGESNSGEQAWPTKVKGVYDNILADLGLNAADTPILLGEMLSPGQCSGHNSIIAKVPNTITNSYVISSASCGGQSDNLHFTSAGYRLLGQRYAEKMLSLLPKVNPNSPPAISTDLANVTLAENQTLKLTIAATGTNLVYKWYENNVLISSATTNTLTIAGVSLSNSGKKYKVVISNSYGTATSKEITLTVTDFLGAKILKTPIALSIDGVKDNAWYEANQYTISNKILTVDNTADLSGTVSVLYDNQNLYFLYQVTDNAKRASSNNFWENDGIEIYIDGNNDKATAYDANDFQFVVRYDGTNIKEGHDKAVTGIVASSVSNATGYVVEVKIPWSTVGVSPSSGKLLGMDFHINDSDAALRDGKLAWFATADNSYSDPSTFGLARLENTVITDIDDVYTTTAISIYPNPAKDVLNIKGIEGEFDFQIFDQIGQNIMSGISEDVIRLENFEKGLYFLNINNQPKASAIKIIIE
jgi:hypothetical protein